jgi:hypothetical protein
MNQTTSEKGEEARHTERADERQRQKSPIT